jgi:hypothetical protein
MMRLTRASNTFMRAGENGAGSTKKNVQKTLTVASCRLSWSARVVSESPSGYSL